MQYKVQSRLEENRKKALDLHLNFIVDQTEKYSSWLVKSLKSQNTSISGSQVSSVASPVSSTAEPGKGFSLVTSTGELLFTFRSKEEY